MRLFLETKYWLVIVVVAVFVFTSNVALAHEHREKGGYEFTVGFMNEPAYEGFQNGVSLRVMKSAEAGTQSQDDQTPQEPEESTGQGPSGVVAEAEMVPVLGLESSLQVEVTHVPSGMSKTLSLRPVFGEPGHYAADLIPTAPGQYRFRFFGSIEGMDINETFESGPDTFNNIQEAEVLQFPEPLPAVREMEGAIRGAQTSAQEAQDLAVSARSSASTASTLGIIGIVLGAVGIVLGIGGVAMGMRKR
jgi:hypothetical protein